MIRIFRRSNTGWLPASDAMLALCAMLAFGAASVRAQRDPAEPAGGKAQEKLIPRPAGAIARTDVDQAGMQVLVEQLVACGTRNSLSSWDDPKHGVGCGRDHVVSRLKEIAQAAGDRLQIVVDKFDANSGRTSG